MGGVTMWPLTAYSVAVIFIMIERIIYFSYYNRRMDDLTSAVSGYIAQNDIAGAETFLSALVKRRLGARVILSLLKHSKPEKGVPFSEHRAERAAEAESTSCLSSLETYLNFMIALGSLSPLTGFLGTAIGMISAFKSISEAAEVNAQLVASGIYQALITSVVGLTIAIIAIITHAIFTNLIDQFAADIERNCSRLILELADHYET